ncbi:gamma-glutamyl-gamma-aminobutyrate hydrolase family protein [Rhizobium panacihumi]|uniref:gamma-glutamyl-gamma-aminobutyrate hydrolase family protein n=1 Tax=Rhizobium panacihumi TaxID=2008450 RepID=UPI003D79F086
MPIIGITTYDRDEKIVDTTWYREHFCSPAFYVDAVRRAGGIPVLLPVCEEKVDDLLLRLDGLIVTGGADIDPSTYGGAQDHPRVGPCYPRRDKADMALAKAALQMPELPILFVCRGMQLLNVVQGGTLHPHIHDLGKGNIHQDENAFWIAQPVTVFQNTLLHSIVQKSSVTTMSGHHQGINELGRDLKVNAIADDGIVEAIEFTAHPFALGVQWHPEYSAETDYDQQSLFDALVEAARKRLA